MSGGSYNYIYNTLSEECEGYMYDEEMNALIKDLCKVLHDLEWWQSCDISKEDYRKTVAEFKQKWLHPTENKGEWIPVTERLPKDGQSVLFCDIDDDIMIGYHVNGRPATHFSQDGTYEDMKNVRAWKPLPEPYKAESEVKPND